MLHLAIEGVASSDIVGWEAHCVFTYTSFISLFPPFIAMCNQLHVMDSKVCVYCLHTKLECIVYCILLFTRGEAIMLINWSIIFSSSHNFAYYAHRFYLLFAKWCLITCMPMTLQETRIIGYRYMISYFYPSVWVDQRKKQDYMVVNAQL